MIDPEILALKLNLKGVVRKIIKLNKLRNRLRLMKKSGLKCVYNNKRHYLYIAKNIKDAKAALFYESKVNSPLVCNSKNFNEKIKEYFNNQEKFQTKLGILFGYPKCCIKEFLRFNKSEFLRLHNKRHFGRHALPNYVMNSYFNTKNKDRLNFLLNNLSPKRLISYFPCSYECRHSTRYAESLFNNIGFSDKIRIRKSLKGDLLVWSEKRFTVLNTFSGKRYTDGIVFSFR